MSESQKGNYPECRTVLGGTSRLWCREAISPGVDTKRSRVSIPWAFDVAIKPDLPSLFPIRCIIGVSPRVPSASH